MEKNKVERNLGILIGLGIASAIFVAGFLISLVVEGSLPEYKKIAYSTNTPADISNLTKRVDKIENDMAVTMRDIAWRMDQKLIVVSWAALAISAIAALIGVQSLNDLRKMAKDTLQEAFDEAIYDVNPANIPVHLPINQDMDVIQRRLQLSGFKKVGYYTDLDNLPTGGVVVVNMNSTKKEEPARQKEIMALEAKFKKAIQTATPDPAKMAFILYTNGKISNETLTCYANLVTANMPPTVANMVLVVGRGLQKPGNQ